MLKCHFDPSPLEIAYDIMARHTAQKIKLAHTSKMSEEKDIEKIENEKIENADDSDSTRKYKIGEYTFYTLRDYRDAQEDLRKISLIHEKLDIQDPETAVKVYKSIREGDIVFKSPIGEKFKKHVSDIVAEKSNGFIADKRKVEEVKGKIKWQGYLGIALAGVAAIMFIYFGSTRYHEYQSAKKAEEMREIARRNIASPSGSSSSEGTSSSASGSIINTGNESGSGQGETDMSVTDPFQDKPLIDASTLSILPEYQALFDENNDMVGWLEIPEVNKPESPFLSYPVVQTERDAGVGDTGKYYYLRKNFDGEDDSNGTLFMDYRSDFVNPTTNTIIYGHNMRSGLMFGNLSDYYESRDFYENHKTIFFNTIYEHREYEVIAVCLSQVNYQDENTFRYYNFIDASNIDEWNEFIENVKSLSIYPRDLKVSPGTELLTLSTCDSYKENGRLFIVAKRVL